MAALGRFSLRPAFSFLPLNGYLIGANRITLLSSSLRLSKMVEMRLRAALLRLPSSRAFAVVFRSCLNFIQK